MRIPDTLAAPAVQILCRLAAEGVTFDITTGGRLVVAPLQPLSPWLAELLRQHHDVLVPLVQVAEKGVQERVRHFCWWISRAPAGVAVTTPLLHPHLLSMPGRCTSCGGDLEEARSGRCWRCALAWRLAVRMPLTATGSPGLQGIRVC